MVLLMAIGISENARVNRGTAFATKSLALLRPFVLKLISAGLDF
jgi:hypothetical protein